MAAASDRPGLVVEGELQMTPEKKARLFVERLDKLMRFTPVEKAAWEQHEFLRLILHSNRPPEKKVDWKARP
jgi:hypothetical protein